MTPSFFIIQTAWATDQLVKIFSVLVSSSLRYWNLSEVWYCAESSSAQYHTAWSQVPRSIILHGVMWLFHILFKGTVKRDFLPVFFIIRVCLGHWIMDLNIFVFGSVFDKIFQFFEIDSFQFLIALSWVPRSIILHGVKFRAVWYCTESLYTAQSQQSFLNTFAQAFKGKVVQK